MGQEEYNKICLLYQVLTKRFDFNQNYNYDKWYKCYNIEFYGVKGNYLEVLKRFEDLTLRHIYTLEYISSVPFSDEYLDDILVKISGDKVGVHPELGLVTLYFLIYRLQEGISNFLLLLETIKNQYVGFIKTDYDNRIYKMKFYAYDEFIPQFENIKDFKLMFHLFSKTNSNYMSLNWNNEVEIDVFKINKTLESLQNFNFKNLDAILVK
ncbi:hypothetical protein [Flavobacterium sp. AED]|jgi:hypothetical protein|uniref:hypothetical protein n=1 Tax=Flavobacterium sp. AED TaxID=1423323 RepID=UPI00057F10A2|nr:hypothetical protein [Flavobacterium sp. AED]KIA82424.1 hypothetical protein OA85_16280 [Flavobacterium sp. AED]